MYKLPILKIIIGSFVIPWYSKGRFSKEIVLPIILLAAIGAVWMHVGSEIPVLNWFLVFLYWVAFSIFAVTCHRLILVDNRANGNHFHISFTRREVRFFLRIIVVYIIVGIVLMLMAAIFMTIINNVTTPRIDTGHNGGNSALDAKAYLVLFKYIGFIPAIYVLGRISLVFPSTAIDRDMSVKQSWHLTKENGWRMFVIVGILPWALSVLIDILWRENATIVEQALLGVVMYIIMAIEIFALSLTYKEFQIAERVEIK